MKVVVNGLGNIGTSIAQLLLKYKSLLNIDQIFVHKRSQNAWNKSEIEYLETSGIKVLTTSDFQSSLNEFHYIFEATPNGVGCENKKSYSELNNLIGTCAQGSEKGFGIPFISGVNNDIIKGEKFVNVVSCNTHGTSSLLQFFGGEDLANIIKADVVVVRRSEDISNHQRLVSGNVIARHLDPKIGTHHAIDVLDLYKTLGINCDLTSSDITTPSQFLHTVRFNFILKNSIDIESRFNECPFIGRTNKFDSNVVFEMGRRYGFAGRLYNHAIIIESNILQNNNTVQGWAFVPQEGNTLISTLHAFLLQTNHSKSEEVIKTMQEELIRKSY